MNKTKILGISATPIKDGNCDTMVREALKSAEKIGDVETEFINTADKQIAICQHCQWCITNMAPCKIEDDATVIYGKIKESDGLIVGSPTWFNTLSPFLLNFMSRARYTVFFTHDFRNKPIGLLTLGFLGFGMDNSISVMKDVFGAAGLFTVASARATTSGRVFGRRPDYLEHGVLDDKYGMRQTTQVGYRVAEVARMVKFATEHGVVIPEEFKYTITGGKVRPKEQKTFEEGVWREKE
jgi:multimeric flavodoxin WrbA